MEITTLTAEHVLRYIFALQGQEAPYGPLGTTWPLFQKFLRLPTAAIDDIGLVQVTRGEQGDPRYVQLVLARQLTDDAAGYGPQTRAIELAYHWELAEPFEIELVDLSSRDFAGLSDFFAAVEALPQFTALDALPVQNADVLVEFLEAGDDVSGDAD